MIKKPFHRPSVHRPASPKLQRGEPASRPAPTRVERGEHLAPARRSGTPPNAKRTEGALRFAALGGLEEIGRNCSFFEYKNEIVVIDVGIQFPEEETPGIDYIIPNISYLEARKEKISGIILTHGHYDHIAAIHYLIGKLGNPVIYTSKFTRAMVEKRHEEFTNAPKLRFEVVGEGVTAKLSEHFRAEFFEIEHTIPEALGFVLETPAGKMVSFGDFRLDIGKGGEALHLEKFARLKAMNIHTLFLDSTNADIAGPSLSERTIEENIEGLIKQSPGRVLIGIFASLVDRILEIIKIADRLGRKVAVNGRSLKTNLEIAKNLGYFKEQKGVMIPMEEIGRHRDEKLVVLTTGAQGEPNAGLMRIVSGEHRLMRLKPTDTVVFSSSVVPGNERSVQALTDNIARQVSEVYNSKLLDIHVSGHANADDLKLVLSLVKPKFVVPIHGYYFKRKAVRKLAKDGGLDPDRVIMMDNGQVAELGENSFVITSETVPAFYVMVDGLGVGDVEEIVLRDRRNLSQEGMLVIIVTADRHGRLLKNPDIISRGFIYLKESQGLLDEIRKRIRGIVSRLPSYQETETEYIKTLIRDQIGQFIYNKTKRRPMILPVVIEI